VEAVSVDRQWPARPILLEETTCDRYKEKRLLQHSQIPIGCGGEGADLKHKQDLQECVFAVDYEALTRQQMSSSSTDSSETSETECNYTREWAAKALESVTAGSIEEESLHKQ
jgi:hypothetical protein